METLQPPHIEMIQGPPGAYGSAGTAPVATRRMRRVPVFLLIFLLVGGIGMFWNYSRDAIYRATATVLTVKPKSVDAASTAYDPDHVAIQERTAMSEPVLNLVADTLQTLMPESAPSVEQLGSLLTLVHVPATNLIELRAEGSTPALLQAAVNSWASAYEQIRRDQLAELEAATTAELQDQLSQLQETLARAQRKLAAFRAANDIAGLESGDSGTPAKMRGLNDSLNKAREKLIEARAARAAVQQAIASGDTVVPQNLRPTLTRKQVEIKTLRDRIERLQERFTQSYIDRDPALRELPDTLQELEGEAAEMRAIGQRQVLEEANQAVAGAERALHQLESEQADHLQVAQAFATVFEQQAAMQAEIDKFHDLATEKAERLARINARNLERYPPLQIVETAERPVTPLRPDYKRDGAIVLGVALFSALFFTWLIEYLTRARVTGEYRTSINVYPGGTPVRPALDMMTEASMPTATLAYDPVQRLAAADVPRELEVAEIATLLNGADELTGGFIALLLSGVSPLECEALRGSDFDASDGTLTVGRDDPRRLRLGDGARRRLQAWRQHSGEISVDALDSYLAVAAVDAGLPASSTVTAAGLWHSYVLYLVRQGARLSDLKNIVGEVSPAHLKSLARYSPPGANLPLREIDLVYPLLE